MKRVRAPWRWAPYLPTVPYTIGFYGYKLVCDIATTKEITTCKTRQK